MINSSQKDIEVFCVALVSYKNTIIVGVINYLDEKLLQQTDFRTNGTPINPEDFCWYFCWLKASSVGKTKELLHLV